MNRLRLLKQIDALVAGEITVEDHQSLQQALKADAAARAVFRERMDLEASLRTWASEDFPVRRTSTSVDSKATNKDVRRTVWKTALILFAIAASVLLVVVPLIWKSFADSKTRESIVDESSRKNISQEQPTQLVGVLRQQYDCKWDVQPFANAGRFTTGKFSLTTGVAELSFDSGTDVVLEAPCELVVMSRDSARLLAGNVFVNVTELSNGFTLETPEARIIDEGTQYAVALDTDSAELHVFDGSVIWIPRADESNVEDRIEAGEAKRYRRAQPTQANRIPFGQRQFVRGLEADIKQHAGDALLAYDGFEYLAGQLRRGRSGFGWSDGWQAGGRGLGRLATVVDAPDDVVFGISRVGRRVLSLNAGDDIRRDFEQPLSMRSGESYFVSFLMERLPKDSDAGQSLQISLEPNAARRGHRRQRIVSFGVTSDGFPFINSGNTITETASRIGTGEVCLCVMKIIVNDQGINPFMRVYHSGETVDEFESPVWTVTGASGHNTWSADSIRMTADQNAAWQIDELKVGTTWRSVTTASDAP